MTNSRELALRLLTRIESDNAYISILLDAELRKFPEIDPRDRALTTELVYGVIRWQKTLDWYLDQVCKKPMRNTTPFLRQMLRLGAYQILMLEKIPPSAAVNEMVKLAGQYGKQLRLPAKTAKGVVNGVLRNLLRQRNALISPETLPELPGRLAYQYSFPEWLVLRWIERLGAEGAEAACRIHNQPSNLTIRINPLKTSPDDVRQQLTAHVRSVEPLPGNLPGFVLDGGHSVSNLPGYQEGFWTIQNASSMLISLILDPHPGDRILETCAGSGVKTSHIGELMGNKGSIVAADIHEGKLQRLQELCQRRGISLVQTVCADMTNPITGLDEGDNESHFDRVLVDAPCSGLGVLRKHPEAKWTTRPAQLAEFHQLQRQLLSRAATYLRPDRGILVYSTCTSAPEENEDVIAAFLHDHPGFRVESPEAVLPEKLRDCLTPEGFLRIDPPLDEFDGFFCARLSRAVD